MACAAIGASGGGALTQLIALGAANRYLTHTPSITFWRYRYARHTNFAMEAIEQPFQSGVSFGANSQLTFNRTGDLIYYLYLLVDLPGIVGVDASGAGIPSWLNPFPGASGKTYCNPCNDNAGAESNASEVGCEGPTGVFAHWTNAIGQYIVRRASIVIGGQQIDTLFSEYLYFWEELAGKPGKRLQEMIGKETDVESLISESAQSRRLYIPLPFWFSQPNASGNALPLVSLQFHGVQLHVTFADLLSCVQTSCMRNASGQSPGVLVTHSGRSGQPIQDSDLRSTVEATYVYLDLDERDRFATGSFEQLITQVQQFQVSARSQQVRMNFNFNHPIIELIWAVRRNCQSRMNNHFCFSGKHGMDPISSVCLRLNNLPRFAAKEGRYFRTVQPYQHHTNLPDAYVYCYSFALHPEEPQPSGSCNFSRIDNVEMVMEMQPGLSEPNQAWEKPKASAPCNVRIDPPDTGDFEVIAFARSHNVLRFRDGLGGVAFSN